MSLHAERIVTLAPALTEIVFALGKGGEIVGNTKFCNFPGEAKNITRVGGFIDINLEILIDLKPSVIFLYPEYYEKIKIMEKKTKLVKVKHTTLKDVFDGVETISKTLDIEAGGKELISKIKDRIDRVRQKSYGKKKLKILLIIGRNPDKLTNMFIVGKRDFLNELLEVTGSVNAYEGNINYPNISIESVVAMNPDLILELSVFNEGIKEEKVLGLWEKFPFISAVKNKKIKIIKDSLWLIPGPRVSRIAEEMYRLFFGEKPPGKLVNSGVRGKKKAANKALRNDMF
jgi:iron complex transport system substrate-binding protein